MKKIKKNQVKRKDIIQAAGIIQRGGLVAFPTETYYGLAVDPFNELALARLFKVKNRSHLKPVLVLIDKPDQLELLIADMPTLFINLINEFWPGPLTLVFPAIAGLPSLLTGATATVGVRQSSSPLAANLVSECGCPITATSANKSGQKAAATAEEVLHIFGSEVDMILNGGKTPGGQGSTLIGYRSGNIHCIRKGCLDLENIQKVSTS